MSKRRLTTGHNGDDGRSYFSGFLLRQQRIGTRGHLICSRRALTRADMLETFTSLSALALMEILGPILLGIALIYAVVRAGRRLKLTPSENARRDEATRRLQR